MWNINGIQGLIANNDSNPSTEQGKVSLAMLTFAWGFNNYLLAYLFVSQTQNSKLSKFPGLGQLTKPIMVMLVLDHIRIKPVFSLFSTTSLVMEGFFLSSFYLALIKNKALSPHNLNHFNLTTLCGAGLGICFWFIEGANYLNLETHSQTLYFFGCYFYSFLPLSGQRREG